MQLIMEFKEQLKKYQKQVNSELEKYLRKQEVPEKILNKSMEYSLMAGGKRLRPILVIATYEIFRKDIEKCMPYAVAIEMVHNFSLIHDDLPAIDNDDLRHGKPTNHKKFNEATAILAGDGLLNYAYMVISDDLKNTKQEDFENKLKVFNEFSLAVDRMIAGEYIDTEYEGKQITDEYLEYIHKNKTGALLKLCVRMGAILANSNITDLEKLTRYAEKIGLAFQIKDDILSEEGNEEVLGKPVGNDKELEKCTYVSKYGLQGAKEILEKITKEAIDELKEYGDKAEFLKELAFYIKNRNK
ncbi:MAG: polyprenyl synthetase family protein [Clostridia bacterium]